MTAAALVAGLAPAPAPAQMLLTRDEALRQAFPPPLTVERRTAFLDEEQLAEARRLAGAGVSIDRSVVSYYVGLRGDESVGAAYFDAHRVRTLQEVVMIVVEPAGRVSRVVLLGFAEPPEYRPPSGWLARFRGLLLGRRLSLKGDVRPITGATLTSRAVTTAVRRVLALHAVIDPFGARRAPDPATAEAGRGKEGGP